MEGAQKILQMDAPGVPKDMLDELFKGLIRTVKTGEMDIVGGVRGPDKNGDFTLVGAIAFEDPSALEKEFKKFVEKHRAKGRTKRISSGTWRRPTRSAFTPTSFPRAGSSSPPKSSAATSVPLAFAFAPEGRLHCHRPRRD